MNADDAPQQVTVLCDPDLVPLLSWPGARVVAATVVLPSGTRATVTENDDAPGGAR